MSFKLPNGLYFIHGWYNFLRLVQISLATDLKLNLRGYSGLLIKLDTQSRFDLSWNFG